MAEDLGRKSALYRAKFYFIRGHNQWLYLPLWGISLVTTIYVLLGSQLEFLYLLFPSILWFSLAFVSLYVPLAIFVGRWDFKRGAFKTEQAVWWEDNPLVDIFKEELEEVKREIRKLGERIGDEKK